MVIQTCEPILLEKEAAQQARTLETFLIESNSMIHIEIIPLKIDF